MTKEEAQGRIDKIFRNAVATGIGLAILGALWMNSVLKRFSETAEALQLELMLLFILLIVACIAAVSFAAFLAIYRVKNAMNLAVQAQETDYMRECLEKTEKALDEARNALQRPCGEGAKGLAEGGAVSGTKADR